MKLLSWRTRLVKLITRVWRLEVPFNTTGPDNDGILRMLKNSKLGKVKASEGRLLLMFNKAKSKCCMLAWQGESLSSRDGGIVPLRGRS